jgi:hypothetical protein
MRGAGVELHGLFFDQTFPEPGPDFIIDFQCPEGQKILLSLAGYRVKNNKTLNASVSRFKYNPVDFHFYSVIEVLCTAPYT